MYSLSALQLTWLQKGRHASIPGLIAHAGQRFLVVETRTDVGLDVGEQRAEE